MSSFNRIFKIAGYVCVIIITVLSLLPGTERPHTGYSGNIEHFAAYSGAAFLLALGSSRSFSYFIIFGLTFVAGLFEVLQFYIPGRGPGLDNFLASGCGATIGVVLAIMMIWPLRLIRDAKRGK